MKLNKAFIIGIVLFYTLFSFSGFFQNSHNGNNGGNNNGNHLEMLENILQPKLK